MPSISVIVPVRNEATGIACALRALLTQDFPREQFEVIRSDVLRANYGQNPWQEKNQVITSVSWVSRSLSLTSTSTSTTLPAL